MISVPVGNIVVLPIHERFPIFHRFAEHVESGPGANFNNPLKTTLLPFSNLWTVDDIAKTMEYACFL